MFIFNNELLLIGVESFWHGLLIVSTSLIAILIFTAATQGWFINKLRWYEIIIFIMIAMSLFRPGYILDKFSPKFENKQVSTQEISSLKLDPNRDVHIKVTRRTEYGDRYRLFVIEKRSFQSQYSLEEAGIALANFEGRITVDNLKWNGIA